MTRYYWGAELARNAAQYHQFPLPTLMAPVVSDRCGGNPFYINAVVEQSAEGNGPSSMRKALNRVLAVDISSGFIWGELLDQINRWIERINEHGITKWVLYLSALDENTEPGEKGQLNVEKIRDEINRREGANVSLDEVREVLVRLSRGDLIDYMELGGWFRRVKDPILLEFLRVWGRVEVERQDPDMVQNRLINRYARMDRRIREYKGYLAEVHIGQVLWQAQRKTYRAGGFTRRRMSRCRSCSPLSVTGSGSRRARAVRSTSWRPPAMSSGFARANGLRGKRAGAMSWKPCEIKLKWSGTTWSPDGPPLALLPRRPDRRGQSLCGPTRDLLVGPGGPRRSSGICGPPEAAGPEPDV